MNISNEAYETLYLGADRRPTSRSEAERCHVRCDDKEANPGGDRLLPG